MESAAQQPGEDEDEPEPFLQLGAAVAPPDAESDDEDQEVVPIAGANEPDVLTSRDDSAGSAQRADAEAALKAAAALAHPAAEAAKAAAEAMEDPAEAAEAAEAAMEEDRVRVEVPHDTLPVSSSSEPPLPQDLPPPLDTDPPEQAPRLRSVSQESPRPPQPTDATQPEEVSHLPRGTRVFLSGGSESVGAYNGHAGVVQAYHETAEAYTVQLDSSGPQDLTVLQVSRHNVTAEAEGSPLPPLSLALPVQDVQDTLQDSSIARDPTLQSVGRSSELDTLHSLHINPGSILGRVLLAYCSQVAKRPKRLLFLYILCAVVPLVVGILFRGFALETDFNAFIKADGSAMRDREAYQLAYEEKKDLTGGRRLEEVQPFLQVDEWIEEVEAEDAEGVRRLLEENYTTAPGRRLRTLFLRKELQLLYRAKNGNILDDKALQDIQAIEEGFRTLPGVRNLCYTRITSESKRFLCDPGISLVAMAFPTQSSSSQGRAFLEFTWDGMGRDLVPPAAVLAYMKTAAEYGDSSRTSRRYFPKTWTYPDVGDFQAESAMPDAARTKFSYHLTLGQNGDPVSQVNANIGKTKEEWNKLITTEMLPYFHKVQSEQVEFYYASTDIDSIEEQSLHSLASTFLETQKDVKAGGRVSKRFSRKRPEESNQGSIEAKSGSETRLGGRGQGPLRTGSLVHLRGPGGGLTTTEDHTVVMRWAGDTSDQKFVVEATEDVERFGFATENVLSGAVVRLRALTDATLVRIAALGDKDEESGKFESWNLVTGPDRGAGDPDCLFSLMLWHEEEYRNARRFALNVRPLNKGCLEVRSFRPSGELSSDFIEGGWRIAAINGRPATAEDVEAILAFAQTDMDDDVSEDGVSPGPSMVEPAESLRSRTQKFMPARTNTLASGAVKGNRYRVCFEKAYGNDMVVGVGEKVVLRVASVPGAGAAAGAVVGFGLEIGHGPSGLDTTGTRAVVVSESADPLPLIVEPADIGSRDDPPLYGWAAEEIRRRAEASQIRASLAEKCRVAVVVGFNSRANGVRGALQACTRELHLRMLRLLVSLVRGYRETEVHFDSHDEIMEELRFGSVTPDNSQPLTVQAVDAEDGIAAAAGVQPGDELVELEVDKNGNRDSLHRGTKEIVQVLGLRPQLAAAKSRLPIGPRFEAPSWAARGAGPAASPPMTLLFRSPERIPVDSGVQKVLVAEAVLVAQLLPTWEEISRPEEFSLEASKSATAARLLRHDEFFRLKCSLVTSLLQQGWELRYAGFAESAMMIHQNLDALTRETIRVRFPNLDDATKEGLLSEQLEVLTASWAAVPRAVKEQQPEQLRRLFRHDVELVAMHDAVDTAYKAWTEKTCDEKTIVEMPATLQRFVERLRPPYAVEALSSAWILRAWFTPEHQHEYELVQRVISRFTEIYENTEQYWIRKLDGAASRMEKTQEQLERALESADMRVALIPSDTAEEELLRIQKLLCPETLVLKADLSLGEGKDAQLIPAGLKLMRRGQVSDFFKPEVDNVELSRRLMELAAGADLRLLFGGDGYNEARKQAAEAIGELGAIIRVVKTAASAFPDVAAQCQELLDKHHKGELRAVTQENKLRIQIQEKEAEEMVRTANIRLMLAEGQKKAAEEKLREAEQERVLAESAKQESQQRADQWWENLQVMAKEKEMLETEKGRLESEKLQWTQVQSLMELEKSELQGDIQKAKEERKRLEHAAEKWHHTLQTVKAQAEEKEAHLKEIQAILQKQQEEAAAKSSAAEEPSQFTVTQLMSVLSKAFSADPGPAAPPSAVASAPAAPTSPVSPSPVSPVRVSAPEVEDASRAPPSSTMKMLTRLYSTYSAAPGPTVQGAAYAAKRGATARELSAD